MQNKIKAEIRRLKKFQSMVTSKSDTIEVDDVDIQIYAKFLLKEGYDQEKRDLLPSVIGRDTAEKEKRNPCGGVLPPEMPV